MAYLNFKETAIYKLTRLYNVTTSNALSQRYWLKKDIDKFLDDNSIRWNGKD
jgi:hypothetical protein